MAHIIFETHTEAEDGSLLMNLAGKAPFKIKISCGKGKCGKCKCRVEGAVSPPTENERKHFTEKELEAGYRLACQVHVEGEVRVRKAEKRK